MPTEQLARSDTVLAVDKTKLQHAKTAGEYVLTRLQTTPCETVQDEQARADIMNRAHVLIQDLEEEREIHVRPLIDDKTLIDGLYRESRKPWEDVKAQCKKDIAAAQQARAKAQDAARTLAAAAVQAGDTAACVAALAQVQENSQPEGAGVSWEWVAVSYDVAKMDKMFLLPDTKKVAGIAHANRQSITPPKLSGVVFERRAKIGVR